MFECQLLADSGHRAPVTAFDPKRHSSGSRLVPLSSRNICFSLNPVTPMPARFMYLENTGHPTSWDATRYADYLKKARARLPTDLQSLTAIERLHLPSMSEDSFWWTAVTYIQVGGVPGERHSVGC